MGQPIDSAQHIEAEVSVIGAAISDPTTLDRCPLHSEDFSDNRHRVIWRVLERMVSAREHIDAITLIDELRRSKELQDAGGVAYVTGLAGAVATTAATQAYAKIISEAASKRRLVDVADQLKLLALQPSSASQDVADEGQRLIAESVSGCAGAQFISFADVLRKSVKRLDEDCARGSGPSGIASGLVDLDDITDGWQSGDLIVVGGVTGMGKSALALNCAVHAALAGVPAVFVAFEMTDTALGIRAIQGETPIDTTIIKRQNVEEAFRKIAATCERIQHAPITIVDKCSNELADVKAVCRQAVQRLGAKLVVIDYLQLMRARGATESKHLELGEITRGLKLFAVHNDVAVMLLSQLRRGVEQRQDKRPVLADLRESGSIEQDADKVLFVYREEYYAREQIEPSKRALAEVIVAKNRTGKTGTAFTTWRGEYQRFDNRAADRQWTQSSQDGMNFYTD